MSKTNPLYIGLMSGTSLDGIDAVLIRTSPNVELIETFFQPFPEPLHTSLLELCAPGENEIDKLGIADNKLGELYAETTLALLNKANVNADTISAIGCHGQTIRHRPGSQGFSLQIGSADVLSARTNIPVVSNFRNHDMALGGQGAPLVPAFHADVFGSEKVRRAIVNIGGMANISIIDGKDVLLGFDTGPGNILMDGWHHKYRDEKFDRNGEWAASGTPIASLLDSFLQDDYFHLPAPKSTGREYFNDNWLAQHLAGDESREDIQATLLELTAQSIASEIKKQHVGQCFICGGGAHNAALMMRLQFHLGDIKCSSTEELGIHPDWVEACAFAWLAHARLQGIPGNAPVVTGASRAAILGALYLP
ncbi:MAG: anhydro-N-acetylmuramic acid kinase [Alcanivoracaceae bacterium]|nr:anhydro-N-acetylmuramic acid kinase [Alcanivoracaceae bacterium]